MSENSEYQFQTQVGVCTITPEQISFAQSQAVSGARVPKLHAVLGGLTFGFGVLTLLWGDLMLALLLIVCGLVFPWLSLMKRQAPIPPPIPRQAIRKVETHPPHPPLIRGYFAVWYEENKMMRQLRLILPGGASEYDSAVQALRAAGLLES
jgi:hypothetical protein